MVTTDLLSSSVNLPVLFHLSGLIQYLYFCFWLISVSVFSGFICVLYVSEFHFILWLKNNPLYVYTTFCLSVDGFLSCFHLLAVVNNIALDIGLQIFECLFLIILDIYLRVKLLGHMIILYLAFWGTIKLLSTVAALFYSPTSNRQEFQFLCIFTGRVNLLSFFFFKKKILAALVYMKKDVIMVLICIPLWLCWRSFYVLIGHLYI